MCVTSLKLNSERARDIDISLPFLETGIAIIVKFRSGVLSPTAFLVLLIVSDIPRSKVSRFMALVWAAFGLTFLAVYTANLAVFMITRVQFYDLNGIHDPLVGNYYHFIRSHYRDCSEPFEYSTWVVILLVLIQGAAFAIFIFEWISQYSYNTNAIVPPDHKFSLCRSYWLVWATLFSASVSTDIPRSKVSRFMALVWAAFGLTFLAVYTANLAVFMITRVQFYDLNGIHDPLLTDPDTHHPPFRYGTVDGGNTHETMRRNWKKMHEYVKNNNFFRNNVSRGVEAVRKEELDAFIYDAVVLDYWAGKDANCELMLVGKWASMTGYGIGLPKNSPYTAIVNQYMLQYQQNGDLERLANFWLTGACSRNTHGQTQSAPLGVENFLSAFFLLGGGIIFSVTILGCEFLFVRHIRRPLQHLDPNGYCSTITMAMDKVLKISEIGHRVQKWRTKSGVRKTFTDTK
ncbi:Ligand-gated ion channel [Dictyocaulus viviparus]|uniref:Ligand-gated ion channel n=1 Tax=Dictyocaulus viviparus TaxID=29172 RepID=A0A0D8Y5R6_DICVI|nr:Ligand-gated ion channel [Dictyocaulus viviparus]